MPVRVSAGSEPVTVRTLDDLPRSAARVLVRVDYNVPLEHGAVADDTRIRASLDTLHELLDAGHAVVLMSHLGRPKAPDPALSMAAVAGALADHLERPVLMAASAREGEEAQDPDALFGDALVRAAAGLSPGDVLLLENLRFHPGEKANEPSFVRRLASLADVYVDDAFGTAHRADASTVGVAVLLPAYAGRLMERELVSLDRLVLDPERPFVAIIGGAKVSGKLELLRRLAELADTVIVGGGIANTFLAASGIAMGDSLFEPDLVDTARELAAATGDRLVLPSDVVIGDSFSADANVRTIAVGDGVPVGDADPDGAGNAGPDRVGESGPDGDGVPDGWRALDVGPASLAAYETALAGARTVVWNGPLGAFELAPFAAGTNGLARAIAGLAEAYTVVGGGDSIAALAQAGLEDRISWVSTGGGAMLALLAGEPLPAVLALAT